MMPLNQVMRPPPKEKELPQSLFKKKHNVLKHAFF